MNGLVNFSRMPTPMCGRVQGPVVEALEEEKEAEDRSHTEGTPVNTVKATLLRTQVTEV